ncbi:MAG TPA: SDR family oxidoreductase [Phycisphaerae bacterium]|nr:SDR family oxidoreductase [Phycisphaerae bacterium]
MHESASSSQQWVLLTGATGYVGGRLLKALEQTGRCVRCLARRPDYLRPKVADSTEVVGGDLLERATLHAAMKDVSTAYYLVHSMGARGAFDEVERRSADNFAQAALTAGVKRIIYLGGLGEGGQLSRHLASRQQVGRILRESGVATIEFRASIIIGSGSLSFEMIRALVDKLPVMITPRWVRMRAQPIAIEDVVAYLLAGLEIDCRESQVFEIGGPDQVPYVEIMREYARQRGLRRMMIAVPVLTPRLSSLWLGLVTPLYARVGRKLIDSMRHDTLVQDPRALEVFDIQPRGIREAIARALSNEDQQFAQTRWSDALSSCDTPPAWGGVKLGSRIVESHSVVVTCSPARAFEPIRRIGGRVGWYYGNWLWRLRGFLDLLVGGPGMRRGRRNPDRLTVGETVDFWRVEAIELDRLLRLCAEMKVPGRAWLQFEIEPSQNGTTVRQTAVFDPRGLAGLAYWYALYPIHKLVFKGMLHKIVEAMEGGDPS